MNEWMNEWMNEKDRTVEKYNDGWNEWIEWMNEWWVSWSMKKMNFEVILNIFCDFSLERYRPTESMNEWMNEWINESWMSECDEEWLNFHNCV